MITKIDAGDSRVRYLARVKAIGVVAVLAIVGLGCGGGGARDRTCSTTETCPTQRGIAGTCLPSPASSAMYCAYTDQNCVGTELRWGALTGDDLAELCVMTLALDGGTRDGAPVDASPTDASPDAAGDAAVLPCTEEVTCGSVAGSTVCVSGRIISGADLTNTLGAELDQLQVEVREPLSFLADPVSNTPIRVLTKGNGIDACGRYVFSISDTDVPNRLVALATYGKFGSAFAGAFVRTGTGRVTASGQASDGTRAVWLTNATVQTWSTAAGFTAGLTFANQGTIAIRFRTAGPQTQFTGTPLTGMTPTWNGTMDATKDHFFSNAGADLTTISTTRTTTGPNGVALFVLGSGVGNVGGCPTSANTLAGTAANLIFFKDMDCN